MVTNKIWGSKVKKKKENVRDPGKNHNQCEKKTKKKTEQRTNAKRANTNLESVRGFPLIFHTTLGRGFPSARQKKLILESEATVDESGRTTSLAGSEQCAVIKQDTLFV